MAKIITQINLLSKYVMGGGTKLENVVGTNSGLCPDDAKFEIVVGKIGGVEIRQTDREVDKDRYVPPHDHPRPKDPDSLEGSETEDMFVRIYSKVEGFNKEMARTNGKNMVHSDTESDGESSLPLHPQKKQKGLLINEPSEASNTHKTNPPTLTSGAPRALNSLKVDGERTILEGHRVSTDGSMSKYPKIWRIIKFHKLEQFTRVRQQYIPKRLREFYDAYAKALLKKGKWTFGKTVDEIEVRGNMVQYHSIVINEALGSPNNLIDEYKTRMATPLDQLKDYISPLISSESASS
ncbi:hypothetical protein MTR67_052340 [Solanum verrucosum]|uniref:Uncharacterized protein n=1 Tax=Solanum verrucosum TaxID=315347 RepID=A0AAF1A366_SOLVR|nr:hypothetical protein MTR67_052340 [Solanum verrucosum]